MAGKGKHKSKKRRGTPPSFFDKSGFRCNQRFVSGFGKFSFLNLVGNRSRHKQGGISSHYDAQQDGKGETLNGSATQ